MELPVSVKLSEIICDEEADGPGNAEPYLWTMFFKIDGETIKQALASLLGEAVFKFSDGSHENLNTHAVGDSDTVIIPPALGEWQTILKPIVITDVSGKIHLIPGTLGVVVVLMEEDNVSDSGAEKGHKALNDFVQQSINDFIAGINLQAFAHEAHPESKLNELIAALTEKIKLGAEDVVTNAIKSEQSVFANAWAWINKDDKIGSEIFIYNQNDIVHFRYGISINANWRSEGHWELFGHIASPDPCKSNRIACNMQKVKIDAVNVRIREQHDKLARASVEERKIIQGTIDYLQQQLVPLQAELNRLEKLLDKCYLRQNILHSLDRVDSNEVSH